MQALAINQQKVYYALYVGKTELVDEYGNKTGEYSVAYSEPMLTKMNISPARGTSDMEQFGINANYTKTMVTSNMDCPITEGTILWIGKEPETFIDEETVISNPHNYIVVQVAKSLNSITYAVKEVSVDG